MTFQSSIEASLTFPITIPSFITLLAPAIKCQLFASSSQEAAHLLQVEQPVFDRLNGPLLLPSPEGLSSGVGTEGSALPEASDMLCRCRPQ
jgi:hypothetical protein